MMQFSMSGIQEVEKKKLMLLHRETMLSELLILLDVSQSFQMQLISFQNQVHQSLLFRLILPLLFVQIQVLHYSLLIRML